MCSTRKASAASCPLSAAAWQARWRRRAGLDRSTARGPLARDQIHTVCKIVPVLREPLPSGLLLRPLGKRGAHTAFLGFAPIVVGVFVCHRRPFEHRYAIAAARVSESVS